jgi:hypothetical protein
MQHAHALANKLLATFVVEWKLGRRERGRIYIPHRDVQLPCIDGAWRMQAGEIKGESHSGRHGRTHAHVCIYI